MASRTSSSSAGWAAVVLGLLAVAAIPAAVAASRFVDDVRLLEAVVVGVPVGLVLALGAVAAARRARYRVERTVYRPGETIARLGRWLAWAGLYVTVTGGLALAFYGLLRWAG